MCAAFYALLQSGKFWIQIIHSFQQIIINSEAAFHLPRVLAELEIFWIFGRILIFGLSTLYYSGYSGFSVQGV